MPLSDRPTQCLRAPSLHRIAAALEARGPRLAVRRLRLLGLLLSRLLLLLPSRCVLAATLAPRCRCAGSRTGARIIAYHLADDGTPCSPSDSRARCRTSCGRRRFRGRLLRRRLVRIDAALLNGPAVTLGLVLLLLLW